MRRNLEGRGENTPNFGVQEEEIIEIRRIEGEKHRNPVILLLAALSMFVAFPLACSKLL
jgi:hypothetical protein